MAINITPTNQSLSKQISINPQAILQIEGIQTVFGAQPVLEFTKWDAADVKWDQNGINWDGLSEKPFSKAVIDLSQGTTNNITQQILPDKGGSSSISTVNVQLVDLNNQIARIFSFDNIDEILGKKADFYIGYKQGSFPEDSIPIFRGVVVDFYTEDGIVMISIAHPETLKRQSIYQQFQTELTSELKYQKRTIQDITYQQRNTTLPTLSIEYINAGIFEATYNELLNRVVVTGMSGKKASEISEIINNTQATLNVLVTTVTGNSDTIQTSFSATPLLIDTTVLVIDTEGLLASQDGVTTYVLIEDELMLVNSIDSGVQLTVTRGQEDTIPVTHDDESEVTSVYKLVGNPINTALKLMLSNDDNTYFNSDDIPASVNFVSISESIINSLIFDYYDIQDLTGLVKGDSIRLTGANAGTYTIKNFGVLDNGSYITVNETLTDEIEFVGTFEYISQYNVLPEGLGMLPNQVDVAGHELILSQFPSNFVDYTFFLKDTLDDTKQFIDEQVYFPQGLYTINRSARSSVKLITPPFASDIVPTINTENITNITKLRQRRSIHKYLYNIIRYDYNQDVINDKFLKRDIVVSTDSLERIKTGRKQLKIESRGLVRGASTSLALSQISSRMIDRYKFAPTYFENIEVKYADGFALEVGDVLPFGGLDTKTINLETGVRGAQDTQLFEVINKSLNIKTGQIKLSILSTGFSIDGRNAVVSLSSGCGSNSTTNRIELTRLVDTGEYINESDKWIEFAGEKIRVYKNDYTEDEEVELIGVDPSNNNFLLVASPLSFTPTTQHIVGIPEYDNTSSAVNSDYKLRFAHYTAKASITSVASTQVFDVDDASELLVGSKIVVSSTDYTDDSFGVDAIIDSISVNTVTLEEALSFTPSIGDKVERSDFLDSGAYYAII